MTAGAVGAVFAGCADTDPNYGAPDGIKGRTVEFPGGEPAAETDAAPVVTTKTPAQAFTDLYNGAGGVPGVKTACAGASCHVPGGGGVTLFVGTDEASAYAIFKDKNYKNIADPKGFFQKGTGAVTHAAGKALQPPLEAIGKIWASAENGGGATTPAPVADAGTD